MGESDVFPTLFIAWRDPVAESSEADLERLARSASRLRGSGRRSLAFTPISVEGEHPFARDGRGPPLVLQLDFDAADDLDAALSAEGPLAEIVRRGGLPSLAGAAVGRQRMLGRRFAVPDPVFRLASGGAALHVSRRISGNDGGPRGLARSLRRASPADHAAISRHSRSRDFPAGALRTRRAALRARILDAAQQGRVRLRGGARRRAGLPRHGGDARRFGGFSAVFATPHAPCDGYAPARVKSAPTAPRVGHDWRAMRIPEQASEARIGICT